MVFYAWCPTGASVRRRPSAIVIFGLRFLVGFSGHQPRVANKQRGASNGSFAGAKVLQRAGPCGTLHRQVKHRVFSEAGPVVGRVPAC